MKQREALHMDYQKHVEYLHSTKAVLTRRLCERFGAEQGAALWENETALRGLCGGYALHRRQQKPHVQSRF